MDKKELRTILKRKWCSMLSRFYNPENKDYAMYWTTEKALTYRKGGNFG